MLQIKARALTLNTLCFKFLCTFDFLQKRRFNITWVSANFMVHDGWTKTWLPTLTDGATFIYLFIHFIFYCQYCQWFDSLKNKVVLEPRVSPAFVITFFCIHCNILDLKIHQSVWIHWPFFAKIWTKGHWPLDDLWPHVCWGHMCDSTQGSLCPSPMTIHQCM